MMNPTKFGSLNLDIPSSSYKFLKFAFKSVKINQEKHFKYCLTAGTHGSTGPTRQRHREQGRGLTDSKLVDGEFTDGEVTGVVFPHSGSPTGTLGWPGGSPRRPCRRAWRLEGSARWWTCRL